MQHLQSLSSILVPDPPRCHASSMHSGACCCHLSPAACPSVHIPVAGRAATKGHDHFGMGQRPLASPHTLIVQPREPVTSFPPPPAGTPLTPCRHARGSIVRIPAAQQATMVHGGTRPTPAGCGDKCEQRQASQSARGHSTEKNARAAHCLEIVRIR